MTNQEKLNLLKEKVCNCSKCPDLVLSRTQHVFGEGNPNTNLVFLGEAPGSSEDKSGRPFVGKSGKLLDIFIESIGLKREEVYILNCLKCHPEWNRNPTQEELKNCRPFLDLQIKVINPKIIVCLGNYAAQTLLGKQDSVNSLRGSWYNYGNARARVTFHPAFILRNPAEKTKAWEDFQEIQRELNNARRSS
jgi:uracil-DNA glycosylase family 4